MQIVGRIGVPYWGPCDKGILLFRVLGFPLSRGPSGVHDVRDGG